jgi:hypothetical protein
MRLFLIARAYNIYVKVDGRVQSAVHPGRSYSSSLSPDC